MADASQTEGAGAAQSPEALAVLQRMVEAREQLEQAEAQVREQLQLAADVERLRNPDPLERQAVEEAHEELERARAEKPSRSKRGEHEQRIADLEAQERMILERMGFGEYDEYASRHTLQEIEIDRSMLEYARLELEDAEHAWNELHK